MSHRDRDIYSQPSELILMRASSSLLVKKGSNKTYWIHTVKYGKTTWFSSYNLQLYPVRMDTYITVDYKLGDFSQKIACYNLNTLSKRGHDSIS